MANGLYPWQGVDFAGRNRRALRTCGWWAVARPTKRPALWVTNEVELCSLFFFDVGMDDLFLVG